MKIIIEDTDGFHKSDPGTRMDMLLMALKRAGYQLRGKPMPSWGCEPTTLLSPYQCGNNWIPIIVGCAFGRSQEVASTHIEESGAQDMINSWDDKHGPAAEELVEFCERFPEHHVAVNHLKWLAEQAQAAPEPGESYRVGQPHPSPSGSF